MGIRAKLIEYTAIRLKCYRDSLTEPIPAISRTQVYYALESILDGPAPAGSERALMLDYQQAATRRQFRTMINAIMAKVREWESFEGRKIADPTDPLRTIPLSEALAREMPERGADE